MMVALTVVLYMTRFIPVITVASFFMLPIPLILLGSEKGPKILMMAVASVAICLTISFGWISSVIYLMLFGIISLIFGIAFYYKFSLMNTIIVGSLLMGGITHLSDQFTEATLGISITKDWNLLVNKGINKFEETNLSLLKKSIVEVSVEYEELNKSDSVTTEVIEEKKKTLNKLKREELVLIGTVKRVKELTSRPMPIFIVSFFCFLSLISIINAWMAKRFRFGNVPPIDFSNWQCPGIVSWIFVICVIGTSYISSSDFSVVVEIMKSISFTMEFMYFLFGLSFVTFLSLRWKLSRTSRVLLYLVSLFYWNFLIIIGLMDSLVNMRKLYIIDVNKGA
ncbi:YybS family protein, partial [bacterium]|nr:YybS family protein [bacterium]